MPTTMRKYKHTHVDKDDKMFFYVFSGYNGKLV